MSRAELRRAKRENEKSKKVYTLTEDQINKIKEDATSDALDTAFILMLAFPIMTLHDHYSDIVKKDTRLSNFMDRLLDLYDCFNKGYVTIQELIDTIEEETGVKIK